MLQLFASISLRRWVASEIVVMDERKDAPETYYCVRRIVETPSSFRQDPRGHGMKPGHFKDGNDEVSVDLREAKPTEDELREQYQELIASRGVGLAVGVVKEINSGLRKGNIVIAKSKFSKEEGKLGTVKEDPIINHSTLPDNPDHGVILGQEKTKIAGEEKKLRKSVVLFNTFVSVVEPVSSDQQAE